ncbi:hypothetical protein Tco_1462966 [Tanacetum coccineum]
MGMSFVAYANAYLLKSDKMYVLTVFRLLYHTYIFSLLVLISIHGSFFILDKLTEVAESSPLSDKIKVVFGQALGEEKGFGKLIQDLCFSLRILLSKKWRLVAELDALVLRGESTKPLEYIREVVARDYALLGDLEKLLAHSLFGVSLKEGYVADMEEKE